MTEIALGTNQDNGREFRTVTASTKVTDQELAQLERAAAARGVRLGEWIREILLRELQQGPRQDEARLLLTEIIGLQMFLTNALAPVVQGERMSAEQYQDLMRHVKTNKHKAAQQVLAQKTE